MPYIHISTSALLNAEQKQSLRACALEAAVTLLGKQREHVMVHLLDAQTLTRGDETGDCAFCDIRVMGAASREACNNFAMALSADVARIAHTAPRSVYLSLSELNLCYTDGCLPPNH